ncbi:MAG: Mpv17/PMP22 family protein [Vitreoscilla sp.]
MTHPLLARLRDAARQNAIPAAVLQTLTLALLLGYYRWTPVHELLERLLRLKLAWGAGYSFVAGALFAGVLPRLVLRLKGVGGRSFLAELAFACLFWGWRSVEVDLFYRWQAHWFGAAADWQTVLAKTAVDQLLYSPLWAVPEIALAFEWKEAGFSWRRARERLDRDFFMTRLPAAMLGNAMVWLPAVIAIYFLPSALQLPVSNFVGSFWVLLMIVLLQRKPAGDQARM